MTMPAGISIRADRLVKHFGGAAALDGLSFEAVPGYINGFIGPDGAGKTTLFRIIAGLMTKYSGRLCFYDGGKEIPAETARAVSAYMPGRPSLYPDLSIFEHLRFFKDLYGISNDVFRNRAEELLEITRLSRFRDRKTGELSGGMYKKTALMCCLLQSPSVMLLDEPTNGVDPISRREFWELLYRLADKNILILISTAYMDEAERCGRVNLMGSGRLIAAGEPGALLAEYGASGFDEVFIKRDTL